MIVGTPNAEIDDIASTDIPTLKSLNFVHLPRIFLKLPVNYIAHIGPVPLASVLPKE
jgi:hypothetical protein